MEGKNIAEILKHLEARRKGAWDNEVEAKAHGFRESGRYYEIRKVAFEEAIRIIKGKGG